MSLRSFLNYQCFVALDPDEWPGEWEELLASFPLLNASRIPCFEFQRETSLVVLDPRVKADAEIVEFFLLVSSKKITHPMGCFFFMDDSRQVFKTNWELRECWDWHVVLDKLRSQNSFLQYFSATGAIIEICRTDVGIRLQHLDYEHPSGLEGSRADLNGVELANVELFRTEVKRTLDYLHSLSALADSNGTSASFRGAFGNPRNGS
jgi:hypothetical protein